MSNSPPAGYLSGSAYGPKDAEADRKVREFLRNATPTQLTPIFTSAYFNVGTLPRPQVEQLATRIKSEPRYELVLDAASLPGDTLDGLVPPEARNTRRCFLSEDGLLMVAVDSGGIPRGYIELKGERVLEAVGVLDFEESGGVPRFSLKRVEDELLRVIPRYTERGAAARAKITLRGVRGRYGKRQEQSEVDVIGPIAPDVVELVDVDVTNSTQSAAHMASDLWEKLKSP